MFPTHWTGRLLVVSLLFFVSSCSDIYDLYEALKDYGYRAGQPLGPKKVPVNETFLGGYAYEQLPVIVSKKDELTYNIKFLHTRLGNENRSVDAFATQFNEFAFLNLVIGESYYFVRLAPWAFENGKFNISVLTTEFGQIVSQDRMKSWLKAFPGTNTKSYLDANGAEQEIDLYYDLAFTRLTEAEALAMQEKELNDAKTNLFEGCGSYTEYAFLVENYPGDPLLALAQNALFNRCNTIEEYQEFIVNFPGTALAEVAESSIRQIIQNYEYADALSVDKVEFEAAVAVNSIEGYDKFYYTCNTQPYKDSALKRIDRLASVLAREDIEKEWEGGNHYRAIRLLFYKIEYMDHNKDVDWIIELATTYSLVLQDKALYQETLLYLDLIVLRNVSNDQYLAICMSKVLLLWADYDIEQLFELYEPKIADTFDSGFTFKEVLKQKYEALVDLGIVFPNQEAVWKKIKKMKVID
jgi:hypothetical protein